MRSAFALFASLIALSLAALPLHAEVPHPGQIFPPPLAPDVPSLPRLTGTDPASARINAVLQRADANLLAFAQECRKGAQSEFTAWAEVTLDGVALLAIHHGYSYFCDGLAHPWTVEAAFLFDRSTGEELDPFTLLPDRLRPGSGGARPAPSGTDPMTELYISLLPPGAVRADDFNCPENLGRAGHDFLLFPDAASQSMIVTPSGLNYSDSPCMVPVALPLALLRQLGAAPRLIAALAGG